MLYNTLKVIQEFLNNFAYIYTFNESICVYFDEEGGGDVSMYFVKVFRIKGFSEFTCLTIVLAIFSRRKTLIAQEKNCCHFHLLCKGICEERCKGLLDIQKTYFYQKV